MCGAHTSRLGNLGWEMETCQYQNHFIPITCLSCHMDFQCISAWLGKSKPWPCFQLLGPFNYYYQFQPAWVSTFPKCINSVSSTHKISVLFCPIFLSINTHTCTCTQAHMHTHASSITLRWLFLLTGNTCMYAHWFIFLWLFVSFSLEHLYSCQKESAGFLILLHNETVACSILSPELPKLGTLSSQDMSHHFEKWSKQWKDGSQRKAASEMSDDMTYLTSKWWGKPGLPVKTGLLPLQGPCLLVSRQVGFLSIVLTRLILLWGHRQSTTHRRRNLSFQVGSGPNASYHCAPRTGVSICPLTMLIGLPMRLS